MMKTPRMLTILTVVLAAALMLAACGGSKSTPSPAETGSEATALPAPHVVQPESPVSQPSVGRSPVGGPGATDGVHTFQIVPEESEARYEADEEFFGGASSAINKLAGLVEAIGRTRTINGEFQLAISGDQVELTGGSITVDLTTLASDDSRRDKRIRKQYLESNKFPMAEFVPTGIENFPAGAAEGQDVAFQLLGDLTVRDITQPVTFDVVANLQKNTLTGTAQTTLRMTDFGFEPPNIANILKVADEFAIVVDFTARQ